MKYIETEIVNQYLLKQGYFKLLTSIKNTP